MHAQDMHARHCPFLNRNDRRCAAHFVVNRLGDAFGHCFGDYGACGAYQQLLSERSATLTIRGRHVHAAAAEYASSTTGDVSRQPAA